MSTSLLSSILALSTWASPVPGYLWSLPITVMKVSHQHAPGLSLHLACSLCLLPSPQLSTPFPHCCPSCPRCFLNCKWESITLRFNILHCSWIALKNKSRTGGMAQALQHLLSKCEALNSNPSTTKRRKKKKQSNSLASLTCLNPKPLFPPHTRLWPQQNILCSVFMLPSLTVLSLVLTDLS
jgi:hypothetical protein